MVFVDLCFYHKYVDGSGGGALPFDLPTSAPAWGEGATDALLEMPSLGEDVRPKTAGCHV